MSKLVTLNSSESGSAHLQIRFCWHEDRFEHEIALINDGMRSPVLRSREGDHSDDWPDSPPLQDISFESRSDHDVVLGVGRAGVGHWSSSFKSCAATNGIEIEHACRVPPNVSPELGSAYLVGDEWTTTTCESNREMMLRFADPANSEKHRILVQISFDEKFVLNNNVLHTICATRNAAEAPRTYVWGYQIELGQIRIG